MTNNAAPTADDEAAWDEAAKDVDVRAVIALRSKGVQREHLARAARFLQVTAFDTVEQLKYAAEALRDDIPELFQVPAPAKSARERGMERARELGWARKP
ncbi:MAG: hypothetical protein JWP11_3416 [Frankiales bacterium]|nr:hypothetical protein [Frankiales bacterium]